jgi:hypothetical protein
MDKKRKYLQKRNQRRKKNPSVPLKKTPSIEILGSDSDATRRTNLTSPPTSPPEPVVVSSDDEDITEIPEAPEEDAEEQLGAY